MEKTNKKYNTTKVLQVCSLILGMIFITSVILNFAWYLPLYYKKDYILEVIGIGNSYTTSFMLLMVSSGVFFIFLVVRQMILTALFSKRIANIIAIALTSLVVLYFVVVVAGTIADVQKPLSDLEKAPTVLKLKDNKKDKLSEESRNDIGVGYVTQLLLADVLKVKEEYNAEFTKEAKQELSKPKSDEQGGLELSDESKEVLKGLNSTSTLECNKVNYMCSIEGKYGNDNKLGVVNNIPYYILVDILINTQSNILNK